jgi:hypothetical protein
LQQGLSLPPLIDSYPTLDMVNDLPGHDADPRVEKIGHDGDHITFATTTNLAHANVIEGFLHSIHVPGELVPQLGQHRVSPARPLAEFAFGLDNVRVLAKYLPEAGEKV